MDKKILITGATGFVGSNILQKLNNNYKTFIIVRNKKKIIQKNSTIINYKNMDDLNYKLKKIKIDTVIHCATHYIKDHSYKDLKKLTDSNILFGNIILENLAQMKVKKFINLSTVWEDYDSIKDNNPNLYAVYKKNFSQLVKYYNKKLKNTKFYNIMISDTFGFNDKRNKIINVLKNNYKNNKNTKIISKNLFLNLLNVEDISYAINHIVEKKVSPDQYILKNKKDYKIEDIIKALNKKFIKKIKITWLSQKLIRQKIYPYKKLKGWIPLRSQLKDIVNIINN